MAALRILLLPISILYGLLTGLRNKFFDWGILPSSMFNHPIICIGNISAGGTGKTPMVEYLIRLLKKDYQVSILSRGFGRKTRGFIIANHEMTSSDIGDEPLQMYLKHPDVAVAVCEKRVHGINRLLFENKENDLILLDDAFQHRYVKPGLNILLSDYHHLFTRSYMLPSGDLREFRSGAKRADALVITKTPCVFSPLDRNLILDELKEYGIPNIFFSFIKYGKLLPLSQAAQDQGDIKSRTIFLITGIANPTPLAEHLKRLCIDLHLHKFKDHHAFSVEDIRCVVNHYRETYGSSKIIVTTEKDSMRLQEPKLAELLKSVPVFYLPIEMEFHKEDKKKFNDLIINFVKREKGDAISASSLN